ncbi:MAG TPA: tryptophan synthase subunit alpha [Candidatus Acidoferrum sp.]|nr:tryptophan synthase subunit alpha [Candidatus Acidoferrum sp.]
MSNALSDTFVDLRLTKRKALIPFLTADFPSRRGFAAAVDAVCESGADILEIGFPHSDPLADGPVIQRSSAQAMRNGFTVERAFGEIETFAARISIPIVIMCYSNLIHRAGARAFVNRCSDSGVSGLIVPDMIIEESATLRQFCKERDISFINLVAPTTPRRRARYIAGTGAGFIYLVSVAGTTGARSRFNDGIRNLAKELRQASDLPLCVGFGISSVETAREAAAIGDGVILGSKLIELIESDNGKGRYPRLRSFLRNISKALGGNL